MRLLLVELHVCQHLPTGINLRQNYSMKYNIFRCKVKLFFTSLLLILFYIYLSYYLNEHVIFIYFILSHTGEL